MEIVCQGKGCGQRYIETNINKPVSTCFKCGTANPIIKAGPNPNPTPLPKPDPVSKSDKALGWLVVKDENASSQTHNLYMGRQLIGRKNEAKPCKIMIDTKDTYMSRNHCSIEVKLKSNGEYQYILTDNDSINGTYVNSVAKKLSSGDAALLVDGDVIQMGTTKVVIKTLKTVTNAQDATQVVKNQDYAPTIIIRK